MAKHKIGQRLLALGLSAALGLSNTAIVQAAGPCEHRHSTVEYVIEPSAVNEGVGRYTCSDCGAVYTRNLKRQTYNISGGGYDELKAAYSDGSRIKKAYAGSKSIMKDTQYEHYSLSFDLNGGTFPQTPISEYDEDTPDFEIGSAGSIVASGLTDDGDLDFNVNLEEQEPQKTGYDFTGWTGSNGTEPNKDVILTSGSSGDKSYFANYTPTIYQIETDLKGGTVSIANPTTYDITSSTITLNAPTRGGSTFTGWTGSNGTTPQKTVQIPKGSIGDKSYTANYNVVTYSISYNLNGGALETQNPTTYTANDEITLNNPTREGYEFAGWTGTDLTEPTETVSFSYLYGNRSYTATWTPIEYTIEYELNGGSIENEKLTYTIEDEFTLVIPEKDQCNFDGWTGSNGDTNEVNVKIEKGTTGNKSYTAHWVKGSEVYIVKRISDINTSNLAEAMKDYLDNVEEADITGNSMADHGASEQVKQESASEFPWVTNVNSSIGSITMQNSGKDINFKGNNRNAGSNAIWYVPQQGSEQAFSFDYNLDFGDSFKSAGFLLRVKDSNPESATEGTISGYALVLGYASYTQSQIAKFTRPKNTTDNINWTTVQTLSLNQSGTLNVTATTTYIEISGGGLSKTRINLDTNYVLNNCGAGYGFYSDHFSHNCSNIGNFNINNLNLVTTTVLTMADVINSGSTTGSTETQVEETPIFERTDSIHFLVNIDTTIDPGLTDENLIRRLKAENAHIIFIGNDTNKASAQTFIDAVGAGTFIQTTGNADQDAANAAAYMHQILAEAAGNTNN